MEDDKTIWNQKYSEGPQKWLEPDPFLVSAYEEFLAHIPPGVALDVAGGAARHALWLAHRGWNVRVIDFSNVGLDLAKKRAAQAGINSLQTELANLNGVSDLGAEMYDVILVFFFLQRELFPALVAALKPGGVLIYKTFNVDQQDFIGGPRDAAFLLQPNELLDAFKSLRVLYYRESAQTKGVAELAGRKMGRVLPARE